MLGLTRLRIVSKLMLLVGLFAAGFALFGAATYATLERVKVGGPIYAGIVLQKDLLADILPPPQYIIEAHLVAHLLGDCEEPARRDALISRMGVLRKEFDDRQAFWRAQLPEGELRTALTKTAFEPAVAFFRATESDFLPAVRKGDLESARTVLSGPMLTSYNDHRAAIDRAVEIAIAQSKELESAAASTLASRTTTLYSLAAAACLLVAAGAWLIARSVILPIRRMEHGVGLMLSNQLTDHRAGNASTRIDLTQRLETGTRDELAALCQRLNTIFNALDAIVSKVSSGSRAVAAGCREIYGAADGVAKSVDDQTRQTESVSAAVLESNQSVAEVAARSQEAAKMSGGAGDDARRGGEIVSRTLDHMRSIAGLVTASEKHIADLGARSEEIGRIIEVINGIADQTNLLALNAAIEAARAGEHGRGFAVVADEVRKLADRTTKATGEVAASIQAIQTGTGGAVASMRQVSEKMSSGVGLAESAGTALGTICDGTGSLAMIIESIASATHEQTSACEEIGRNVALISQAGQECSHGARQAASIATDLTTRAESLEQLVAGFRVSNPA